MKITILNCRLWRDNKLQHDDVFLQNGQLCSKRNSAAKTIDACGKILMPAVCAFGVKADSTANIIKQCQKGGIGSILLEPDSFNSINDHAPIAHAWQQDFAGCGINVAHVGACTQQLAGEKLAEMAALKEAGSVGLGDGARPWRDQQVLKRTLQYAQSLGIRLHLSAQNHALMDGGCAHNGETAQRLGLSPIPVSAETSALATIIELAIESGCALHINNISSARAIQQIKAAKASGLDITCDVSIHHLLLNETAIEGFNTLCHIAPPLRAESDRKALLKAVNNGVIDVISAAHRPFSFDDKAMPFAQSQPGIAALELLLPLTLLLVKNGELDLCSALAAIGDNPRKIINAQASKTWLLVDERAAVTAAPLQATPYTNWQLYGTIETLNSKANCNLTLVNPTK